MTANSAANRVAAAVTRIYVVPRSVAWRQSRRARRARPRHNRARAPTPDFYYSNYDPKVRPGGRVQLVLHAPRAGSRRRARATGRFFPGVGRCWFVLEFRMDSRRFFRLGPPQQWNPFFVY